MKILIKIRCNLIEIRNEFWTLSKPFSLFEEDSMELIISGVQSSTLTLDVYKNSLQKIFVPYLPLITIFKVYKIFLKDKSNSDPLDSLYKQRMHQRY